MLYSFFISIYLYTNVNAKQKDMSNNDYKFPTEVIDLPSQGKQYPDKHPLSNGTIEIKYMTAKEEDILASTNLIKKGIVLDKLLESVVVEKGLDVGDIFIGDKNAVLLATRVLGYGPEYNLEVNDPFTGEPQKTTINLAKIQIKEVDLKKLSIDNRYEFVLPSNKLKIKYKLLTHKDEVDIAAELHAMQRLSKNKDAGTSEVSTRLRYMIVEVDGNDDRGFINKWVINNFLARDSKALRKHVKEISPDLDLTYLFTSDITGESEALDIPFGAGFFYPSE